MTIEVLDISRFINSSIILTISVIFSQAGDSSTEATSGPPSVYANAGLYGPVKKEPVKRRRTHSGSLGLGGGCPSTSESVGKKPALKKYDQFSCAISRNFCYKKMNK